MGMFDTVILNCKNCGYPFEVQSKGRDMPSLEVFRDRKRVPTQVAAGIEGRSLVCPTPECRALWSVRIASTVKVKLVREG